MDLKTKHRLEKNIVGNRAALFLTTFTVIISLLNLVAGVTVSGLIRIAICFAIIGFNLVTFSKYKVEEIYIHCCCSSMILLFLTVLCTSKAMYMYAIMYPITIMVMLYSDRFLMIAGSCVAIIGVIGLAIFCYVKGYTYVGECVVSVIFGIVVCVIASSTISLQIKQAKENLLEVQNVSDAQLSTSGKIIDLANELNETFVSVRSVAEALNESVVTSHNSVSEIAEGTRVNAEALDVQTSQTAEIQESIQAVGEEASNMEEISQKTNITVNEGVELIKRLKNQACEVAKINTETKQITEELNTSIQDVQAITDTILGISSQTNLLALNASIEAARAGEAGKGFAVVADEIRNLAEDTRKATEQIGQIISRLTEDAERAAVSMTHSAEVAEKENVLIEKTGEKLEAIKTETDALSSGIVHVNNSVDNIIQASSAIMDSITNLSATSQEVAAASDTSISISEQAVSALKDMNALLTDINSISTTMESVAK